MTSSDIEAILAPLSRLNAWCRVPYSQQLGMSEAIGSIYRYKLRTIKAAVSHGMATLRLVSIQMQCLTCKGTGIYWREDWGTGQMEDMGDCRRCSASGRVILTFVETTIGNVCWHTPWKSWDRDIYSFEGVTPERIDAGDWKPGEPGDAVLERLQFIELMNQVERLLCGDRLIHWHNNYYPRGYRLHLGRVDHCAFCERTEEALTLPRRRRDELRAGFPIYRPGFVWEQGNCYGHAWKSFPAPWPLDRRRWYQVTDWQDYAPVPAIAYHPAVTEWLARRGIVIGALVPGDHAYTTDTGEFVEVLANARDGGVWVRFLSCSPRQDQRWKLDAGMLSSSPRRLLVGTRLPDFPVSSCCRASLRVDGDRKEGMMYYVCTQCESPCDAS